MAVKPYPNLANQKGWRVQFPGMEAQYFPIDCKHEADALNLTIKAKRSRTRKSTGRTQVIAGTTLGDVLDDYLNYVDAETNSIKYYRSPMKNFIKHGTDFLDKRIDNVSDITLHNLLERIWENRRIGRTKLQAEVDLLAQACNRYGRKLGVSYSPKMAEETIRAFRKKYDGSLAVSLSPSELTMVLEEMKDQNTLSEFYFLVTQFIFGERCGETNAYTIDNVNFDIGYVLKNGNFNSSDRSYVKSKRLKETAQGRVLTNDTGTKVYIEHVLLTAFFMDVVENARRYSDEWLFPTENGKPTSYSTYSLHLRKTGFFSERGMTTHKIRKTTKTLGEIESRRMAYDPTETLLRHTSKAVQQRYRDVDLISRMDDLPTKLFVKYVLPIYKPTESSISRATNLRTNNPLKLVN